MENSCGVLAAWGVLTYFNKFIGAIPDLVRLCRYTINDGVFTIALASALRQRGLTVDFFTDPDPDPNARDMSFYPIAAMLGVRINPAIGIDALLAKVNKRQIPVVLFMSDEETGHLSPMLGSGADGSIHLPYYYPPLMPKDEFVRRWSTPDVLRQCLIASDLA